MRVIEREFERHCPALDLSALPACPDTPSVLPPHSLEELHGRTVFRLALHPLPWQARDFFTTRGEGSPVTHEMAAGGVGI